MALHAEVIVKYRDKIRRLGGEMKAIMKQEEEERQLRLSDMEVNKARNLVEHQAEILSRPARTWIQERGGARGKRGAGEDVAAPPSKKAKKEKKPTKKAETVSLKKE